MRVTKRIKINRAKSKIMIVKYPSEYEENLSVGIVGCGWLGKALAKTLLEKGASVLATSSKLENVEKLNKQGINAQQLTLAATNKQLVKHDIFGQQRLVIAITPQFKQGRTDYADKVAQLVSAVQQRGYVQQIILLSSTAVYHGLEGNVNEESPLNLTTEKVQILNAAEQAVLSIANNGAKQGNVIRLAGLVGPERHPGKFLLPTKGQANKTLNNSAAPVNLVHQQDAVGLIESLLQVGSPQGIFNGVSDTHVSKKQYYQAAAKALSLQVPVFSQEHSSEATRKVCGEKAKKVLSYKFIYPDLLTWL